MSALLYLPLVLFGVSISVVPVRNNSLSADWGPDSMRKLHAYVIDPSSVLQMVSVVYCSSDFLFTVDFFFPHFLIRQLWPPRKVMLLHAIKG